MEKRNSYIDSSLIIHAVERVPTENTRKALDALGDPNRNLIVSDFVELETLPKMLYNKEFEQSEITKIIFNKSDYIHSNNDIIVKAKELAAKYGLSAIDALHSASAIEAGADELLTFEKPSKPFFRIPQEILKVVSLHNEA